MTLSLPEIQVPVGAEKEAAALLRSLTQFLNFTGNPLVVSNPALRTTSTSLEHSLTQAALELEEKTAALIA